MTWMDHIGLIQILMLGIIQVADGTGILITAIIQIKKMEPHVAFVVVRRIG